MNNSTLKSCIESGKERGEIERALLICLFNGFSQIEIKRENYKIVEVINQECCLERYAELSGTHVKSPFIELSDPSREFCYLITALDSMCSRGLMEKRVWFIDNFSPEEGAVNLAGKLDGTEARFPDWIARAILNEKYRTIPYEKIFSESGQIRKDTYEYSSLDYEITEKGYDVALIIESRADDRIKFEQQAKLQRKAIEASESSAKSAEASRKIATLGVIAAYIIGVSSLVNAVIQISNFVKN